MNEGKIEIKEMERRIEAIQRSHEDELKTSRILHQQFAVEYFKKMALEANKKFNDEMSSLHAQYEQTRMNYMKSEKKI